MHLFIPMMLSHTIEASLGPIFLPYTSSSEIPWVELFWSFGQLGIGSCGVFTLHLGYNFGQLKFFLGQVWGRLLVCFMCFMKHTNKPAPSPAPDYYYHVHHGSVFHVKNGGIHSHFGVHTKTKLWYSSCIYKTKLVQASWKNWQRIMGLGAVLPFLFRMKRMQNSISEPVLWFFWEPPW